MRFWCMLVLGLVLAQGARAHEEAPHVLDTSKEGMKLIAKSLGVECTHCHIETGEDGKPDFEAPSRFKNTAIYMKVHFVDSLKTVDGEALTCVACHNGTARFLPRDMTDAKPSNLGAGMDRQEIVNWMKEMAKELGVECTFCHVKGDDGRLNPVAPTQHKQMAKYMMEQYTGKLLTKAGKPVTCGTCHAGKAEFLPRHTDGDAH